MKYFIYVASILFTAFVVYDMAMWIIISSSDAISFEDTRTQYLNRYPSFIRSSTKVVLMLIILSIFAGSGFIVLQDMAIKVQPGLLKIFAGLAFLLAAWRILTLM